MANFDKHEPVNPKARNALLGSQHLTSKTNIRRKYSDRNGSRQPKPSSNNSSNNAISCDTVEDGGTYRIGADTDKMNYNVKIDYGSEIEPAENAQGRTSPGDTFTGNQSDNKRSTYNKNKTKVNEEKADEMTKSGRAASVIQTWWRRVRIRKTAGAAAIKRMMEQKQFVLKQRLSMERETVSFKNHIFRLIFFSFSLAFVEGLLN